jgi:triphosphoribosyl-dephospho-CoA synthase
VHTQLQLLSRFGDSLIARKCGAAVSQQVATRATHVLAVGAPGDADYQQALAELDFWLRSDRHQRNPGTTADLIAAGLFVALRDGRLTGIS